MLLLTLLAAPAQTAQSAAPAADSGCVRCHEGIEWIRDPDSEMMQQILALGRASGDPQGCTVCHGGDATAEEKEPAHQGEAFYADPGSPWVNENTCGRCHADHVRVQWNSLMMTEAGKIQGTAWSFGALTGYEHRWGNYDAQNPEDPSRRLGTETYRRYMEALKAKEPQVFVDEHVRLPDAPSDLGGLRDHPERAVFTYLRSDCLRCHHAVKGRQVRGDFRGMGCSSCHIPYSNEGYYEGDDPTIAKDERGHMLVHSIQGTREAKVTVNGTRYSGIPAETCTTCHNRGKRIGVSYQGLMEMPYHSPFTAGGGPQPGLHTKHYLAMEEDVHYQKGMLCQDCHTSVDVHGDGFLAAANLGAVEIECSDCHGTPNAYPWELPLGHMDEFAESPAEGPARGTGTKLVPPLEQGTPYPARDGYLLSARGNPYTNAVRDGNKVIVHTAGGEDLTLKPLKLLEATESLSLAGRVAMRGVARHLDRMECYTCHATRAPQCYGCHVKVDYSGGATSFDWLSAGHEHAECPTNAAQRGESGFDTLLPGKVEEQRSYTRWEDPPLGVNGEGRVSPVAPGCQTSITVVGEDGDAILLNHIFRTNAGDEGSGKEGQLAIDMSPTQPHTITKHARSCESCHLSVKALGHGIGSGRDTRRPDQPVVVDLKTADGRVLPRSAQTQFEAIAGLTDDWSRFVTEGGEQLQTVGHHFTLSRPLNDDERTHVGRDGLCLSCHQEIPEDSLAVNILHHVAEYTGRLPRTHDQHNALIHKSLLLAGWVQVGVMGGAPLILILGIGAAWFWRRRKLRAGRCKARHGSNSPRGGKL